ncbi:hypothetical protein [Rhodococcus koreensis]
MGNAETVRASRDGDRFHYYWAARRALRLLDFRGDLKVVGVEGLPAGEEVEGEEVVDVAEYYGGRDAETCTTFRYAQLKHSTMRTEDQIIPSELKKTLEKFAEIYRGQLTKGQENKLQFVFVANRTLNDKARLSLTEIAAGADAFTHAKEAELLRGYMGFGDDTEHEAEFCRRFNVDDGVPGIADMEQVLRAELQQFLPGGGTGTELSQLMETISRCATSLADKQTLETGDILLALRTTEEELFPARSAIERLDHVIHTLDVDNVSSALRTGTENKILVTAVGGVGKSILTSMVNESLPSGSVTIVYDCFAGGDYRKVSSQRHEHRVGLTQIANDLAAEGLCTPLIPTMATDTLYMQVFMRRVQAASEQLARENPAALLAIVIDAADNAAMAAGEQQQRTFVTDLFREDWPANSRIVQLCRPERKTLLQVPRGGVTEIPLLGFQKPESLEHLRMGFLDATEAEGAELHALSDGNPRVQAMAMKNATSIKQALIALQIAKNSPGQVLDSLLAKQVDDVADRGYLLADELLRLCTALATLHPPIPLSDLADITKVDADAIRSFAVALGRGLHAAGNTLQFRDEPTETWFRTTYGLEPAQKREFATTVEPLAARSPYIASMLPQLFFEADMLEELVDLALSDGGLPGQIEELQALEIARARARFALAAMLRAGRNADAALLAVRAGDMSSGHSRKMKMFRTHTDLVGRFLGADVIDALCSGRELATDWPGSSLHVEAALYSQTDHFQDTARGRMRTAFNNFVAILNLPETERPRLRNQISANEVADLAMTATNLDGPAGALGFMCRWHPESFVRRVAAKLSARLADAGRHDDLAGLVTAEKRHMYVQAAVAETMFDYNLTPPDDATEALVKMMGTRRKPFPTHRSFSNEPDVRGVVWALVHGLRTGVVNDAEILRILDIHLPERVADGIGSRLSTLPVTSLILAFALRARVTGTPLTVDNVASDDLIKAMEKSEYSSDHNARDFRANIPGLLPWAECWLAAILDGHTDDVVSKLEELVSNHLKPVSDYNTPYVLINTVAEIATRTLTLVPRDDLVEQFERWHENAAGLLTRSRLAVARIASRSPHLEAFGLGVVMRGIEATQQDRTDADTRVDSLIDLARTLLATNESEARAIFDEAVNEAEKVGDDLIARWQSLTNTAKALPTGAEAARAYRLFQIGEALDRAHGQLHQGELAERLRLMHEPTYFAATSRARDRRTLDFAEMLSPAFASAGGGPGQERLALLALYAFEPRVTWPIPVADLAPASAATATRVFDEFTKYEQSPSAGPKQPIVGSKLFGDQKQKTPIDQSARFTDLDFTTEEGWNRALTELGWRTEDRQALAEFAIDKHSTRRPEVLDALGRAARATQADFANLAQAAAQRSITPALRRALERFGTTLAARFARSICARGYENDDTSTLATAIGTTTEQLTATALRELGRSAHQLNYKEYFYLAATLAHTLDPNLTGDVFDSLAHLFDDLAPPHTSSDGPYDSLPTPPHSVSGIAGVIWAALGDMASQTRWQAAHAVLLLVRLGCKDELDALLRLADGTDPTTPFTDARFPFYTLHARMWLLLALARAAQEPDAAMLTRFTPWLTGIIHGPHHAANQTLAQRTLLGLSDQNLTDPSGADADALTKRLAADWVELEYQERLTRPNPLARREGEEAESERYPFFIDFQQYWCNYVAEVFGSTEEDVARRATQVARELDGYDIYAAGKDPRGSGGVYSEGRTYADHSRWPTQETLDFYLAVHALLTVGAELAQTEIAYKEPDSVQDSYNDWLARFLPKRPDGRWLADRRDSPPTPTPDGALRGNERKEEWPWSLSKTDFENVAGLGSEWVTVWASVDSASDELSEDTLVTSALVPHETSRALLVTLQTSPIGPAAFGMPTTNDQYDRPDNHPFELIPWLDTTEYHYGIDNLDERGGGIKFPPTGPGADIITGFNLAPDEDHRMWFHEDTPVFRGRTWNNMRPTHNDRETGTRGERFEVRLDFLMKILGELERTLVLQVSLRRDTHRPYYERRTGDDDELGWLERSGKVYLIDPGGHWLEY